MSCSVGMAPDSYHSATPAGSIDMSEVEIQQADPERAVGAAEVLTVAEVAELFSLSERTILRYVEERRIPFVRLPKRGTRGSVRFLWSELQRWLARRTVKPDRVKT